ncbi:GDSL-type esterase/lipase family protein [Ilumatobacter nonamiensis]|uniref:GDSL-type esterase/lipase family protein n=1 Tax=Ilumatobacter nonamiensis TaxID=467093 RepID=UPI00034D156C|nr:GDSL-type esterase/lipase family protein [Ilumatobacter nonamiensis]
MNRFTKCAIGVGALIASTVPLGWSTAGVQASPGNGPTAIVSLGDSFISGEAGRWNGNSNNAWYSRNGTDRAFRKSGWFSWFYDTGAVYPGTVGNGCHRSDVAPIRSNTINVQNKINLACSGAETAAIVDTAYKGEAPQSAQLLPVAQANDVEMIVLSIGGNDLGFSDIIVSCTLQFSTSPSAYPNLCLDDQQPLVDQAMPAAMAGVDASIDAIRSTMSTAGYSDTDYRLVVVSYPSPVPRGNEIRYSQSGYSRLTTGGCPFWNDDATWARDSLVPQISDNLRAVAAANGTEFLDFRDAFQGNENCSKQAVRVGSGGPDPATAEWARWVGTGTLQGDLEESVHPNAYGQQALGRCLTLLWEQSAGGQWACNNTPNQGPGSMILSPG